MLKKLFLILSLIISIHLHANDGMHFVAPTSAANEAALPSSVVNGCVNVVTGDFICREIDHEIKGIEPVTFTRHYSSSDKSQNLLMRSWHFDPPYWVHLYEQKISDERRYVEAYQCDENGICARFQDNMRRQRKEDTELPLDSFYNFCNCFSGEISARTHPLHNKLKISPDYKKLTCTLGYGGSRGKLYSEKNKEGNYQLLAHYKINNNKLIFSYNKSRLKTISVVGPFATNSLKAITFDDYDSTLFKQQRTYGLTTCYNQKVDYHFKEVTFGEKEKQETLYYLEDVSHPGKPKEHYEYGNRPKEDCQHLIKRTIGDRRFQEIEYYGEGENPNEGNFSSEYPDSTSPSKLNKVKRLKAPVGNR